MYRLKWTGRTIRCRDAVTDGTKEIGELQLVLDLDRKARGLASIADGNTFRFRRLAGVKPFKRHTGGGIVAFNGAGFIGAIIVHREDHAGQVKFGIALVVLRLCGSLGHRNALHLFQRHGLGAVLGGRHFADGGLIALVVADGGIGVRDALQQLIDAVALRLNSHVAPLDGQGRTRGRDIEGHVHPGRGILLQRNANAVGICHGVALTGHGHAAGLLRVAGAGHGVGIRCIGGGQRHSGGAGISAAVYRKHSILGLNGKGYRRGGGLPAEGGIVAGLGHEGAA